ncbi:MAG: YabP/YqfC family sporulation protein [Oscillospiraceae bacterium]|jgi:hypothetical protein|nr:YabP/YqfC family sporulation protein [Oscillospiraceae bacterium]
MKRSRNFSVIIEKRERATLSGIIAVGRLGTEFAEVFFDGCGVKITGEELHVVSADTDGGEFVVEGRINGAIFFNGQPSNPDNIITQMFR